MKLSKKLYSLRKKNGLSQEQLAEQLNVSRQAISKWESGASIPESEKLIAISAYFNVSVDFLVKDAIEVCNAVETAPRTTRTDATVRHIGLGLCILGFIFLIVGGIIMLANPSASDTIAGSSVITIDGCCILFILCFALIAVGVILLLKKQNRR